MKRPRGRPPKDPATGPTWRARYRMGIDMAKHLDGFCTFEQVAAEIGTTPQNAYTESMLALGAFCFGLRQKLGVDHIPER